MNCVQGTNTFSESVEILEKDFTKLDSREDSLWLERIRAWRMDPPRDQLGSRVSMSWQVEDDLTLFASIYQSIDSKWRVSYRLYMSQ